jgi:flagellar biosynthesis/type III secretory pathway chaperone
MSTSSEPLAVGRLLETLVVATALQSELAALLNHEHRILTAMSVEDLMKLDARKEAVLERVRVQAQEVKTCMRALAQAVRLPEAEARSLSGLASHLKEPDRTRLRKAQETLISLTRAVREQNLVNDRLIHSCLAYVTQFMDLLRSMLAGVPGYLHNGAVQESSASGRLLALKG